MHAKYLLFNGVSGRCNKELVANCCRLKV